MSLNFDGASLNHTSSISGAGGSDASTLTYEGISPIKVINGSIYLKIDEQLLQINENGQLTVNLNEIGAEMMGKANTDLDNISDQGKEVIKNTVGKSKEIYGIMGDYANQYGILDCPNGLINYSINNKEVEVQPSVVLQLAGSDTKTMIASKTKYEIEETGKVTLFFTKTTSESGTTQLGFIEAGDVFYQEEEPTNGKTSFIAWWKPSLGLWQFKSNYTGNVWRTAIATPIANINAGATGITSINYIGYRVIDDDIFAQLSDIESIEDNISTINENISFMQISIEEFYEEINKKQNSLLSRQLLQGTIPAVAQLAENADLSQVIGKVNEIVSILVSRGIATTQQ